MGKIYGNGKYYRVWSSRVTHSESDDDDDDDDDDDTASTHVKE